MRADLLFSSSQNTATMESLGAESVNILKPRNDKREYRRLVLPNAMEVLLISDPETDKAGAAMDVHVGSFCDPQELPGLAHFLEHMLFFSSEKYPQEDALFKFVVEHGGQSNAYTVPEHTNFYFEVSVDHLRGALDRFAQFFISPLFSVDAVSREINAIDSENKKNLTTDAWRMNQLSRRISSRDHPFHRFGSGNSYTLDVKPKEEGIDTHKELIAFYQARYSSNLMRLAIYGRESLNELQKLAEELFSEVRNTNKDIPRFAGKPCSEEHLQVLIKAVPVKDGHSLMLMWPSTPEVHNYQAAPSHYLGHMIGHEADGSLFCVLKKLGWANTLYAGEMESTSTFAFFVIDIELTDLGQEHMQEIVGLTFQYLRILQEQGVEEWIFEELQGVSDMRFNFQDKFPVMNYVSSLAHSMQLFPPEDWLAGSKLPRKFDREIISRAMKELSGRDVRIFWSSKQFQGTTTEVEPWYSTPYIFEKINDDVIKAWEDAPGNAGLHLPSPNVFIAKDFSLISTADAKVKFPVVLKKTPMSRLWYKPDTKFATPKACVDIHFHCAGSNHSPESSVLTRIFIKLLVDYWNEYAYFAEVADLRYRFSATVHGFQLSVFGYSDKLMVLLEKFIEKITNFHVDEERFPIMKQKVLKDYLNFRFQQPYLQAMYNSSLLLEHKRFHVNEFIEVLPQLTAEDMRLAVPHILSRVFFECYVTGNVSSKDAEDLADRIEKTLSFGPIVKSRPPFPSQLMEQRIVKLEDGADFRYLTRGLNAEEDENSAIQVYFQVDQDNTTLNVLVELFVLITKEGAFHQLRTVEQLGYLVFLGPKNDVGVRGIQFIIQSTVKNPAALDERVEAFIDRQATYLQKMTNEEFAGHVAALIEIKLEKHKNLWEESDFFWAEIEDGTIKFDRPAVEVKALQGVNKQDLVTFFETYIQRSASKRRKLSLHVYGRSHIKDYNSTLEQIAQGKLSNQSTIENGTQQDHAGTDEASTDVDKDSESKHPRQRTTTVIDDMNSFKRAQALFPSLKGGLNPVYNSL